MSGCGCVQEQRKGAISRSVDVEELEKGVKHSILVVNVSLAAWLASCYECCQ